LRVAGDAVFAAAWAIRLVELRRLGPVVVGFALIERVTEDLANTTWRPAPVACLAGTDALGGEPLMDGIGTEMLFHAPAIDQADDLRFSLVDDQMLRRGQGFPDVGVSIGGIPPVDTPLTRGKQAASSGALLNERAFVLGKDALHLQQHLFFWTGAQVMLDKDDCAATAAEFFDQEYLIGITPREAIRYGNEEDLEGAFRHEITQAVKRRAIKTRATDAFINKDARGRNVIARCGSRFVEQIDLTGDGLFPFLFFSGDACIQGRACQPRVARCRVRRRAWGSAGGPGAEIGTEIGWGDGGVCRRSSMACHRRSFPWRHGTWTQTIASAGGGFGDAIRCSPV